MANVTGGESKTSPLEFNESDYRGLFCQNFLENESLCFATTAQHLMGVSSARLSGSVVTTSIMTCAGGLWQSFNHMLFAISFPWLDRSSTMLGL